MPIVAAATREREVLKLVKTTKLLFRPLAVESITSSDGYNDQFIQGQDWKVSDDGTSIELLNDALEGKDVQVVYHR